MATSTNVIRTLTIRAKAEGAQETTAALKGMQSAYEGVAKSSDSVADAVSKADRQFNITVRTQRDFAKAQSELAASNDNMAKSVQDSGRSFADMASEVISLAGHLKLVAGAAYLAIPAFRSLTNQAVVGGLTLLGGQAGLVASGLQKVGSALGPAFSFISKITIPITAAVAAFELLSATIKKGSDLLDQFGTQGRRGLFDDPGLEAKLKELTKFQQSDLTIQQQQQAGDLARRLEDANFQIKQFLSVSFSLVEPALALQAVWVSIVETIARGVNLLPSFSITPERQKEIIGRMNAAQGLIPEGAAAPKGDALGVSNRVLRERGLSTLGAAMGGGFSGRFNALTDKAPEKEKTAERASEFDRLANSIERSTAAMEADAQTVGKSAGEVGRLRTEYRLLEVAQQEIAKNGGNLQDYADKIKLVADRAGQAAQKLEEARLRSQAASEFTRSLTSDLSNGLVDVASGAKNAGDAFANLGDVVLRNLTAMILKVTLFNQLERSLTSAISGALPAITPVTPSAKGNVFDHGNVVPFARGGLITKPVIFPMAGGAGLAGEAGPEAVVPLRRGANGELGVQSSGGDQVVNVNVSGAPSNPQVQQSKGPNGEMNVDIIFGQFEGRMADNMRRGKGPMPGATAGRFGLDSARGNLR